MATKSTRMKITFECTECKNRNYDSFKNKRNDPDRLELKKYCPVCKKHTVHKGIQVNFPRPSAHRRMRMQKSNESTEKLDAKADVKKQDAPKKPAKKGTQRSTVYARAERSKRRFPSSNASPGLPFRRRSKRRASSSSSCSSFLSSSRRSTSASPSFWSG